MATSDRYVVPVLTVFFHDRESWRKVYSRRASYDPIPTELEEDIKAWFRVAGDEIATAGISFEVVQPPVADPMPFTGENPFKVDKE